MIKNIIFDFGAVILDLRPDRCIEQFCAIGYPQIRELLNVAHQQGPLGKIEEGLLSANAFCDAIRDGIRSANSAASLPDNRHIIQAFSSMADGIPHERLDCIAQLKRDGYHVAALSNTNVIHWGYCQRYFIEADYVPTELFEHLWLSCDLHLVKPDPRIFEHVLRDSGFLANETLFIDDNSHNCAVAESFGIRTMCPPPRTDWRADLNALLLQSNR